MPFPAMACLGVGADRRSPARPADGGRCLAAGSWGTAVSSAGSGGRLAVTVAVAVQQGHA